MSTPHNEASYFAIAQTVLMPGDPKRSQFIAENFLKDPVLVNDVRGVHGYTGLWNDVPVTVMASGMGMPSIGIYSWELFSEYGVENIIRIGSAGALQDDQQLKDIIIAQGACTNSNYISNFGLPGTFAPVADYTLLTKAVEITEGLGFRYKVGNLLSSDNFYSAFPSDDAAKWKQMGILGIEMEAAALYCNAAYFGRRALCICSVSDHIFRDELLDAQERQVGFSNMIRIALDTAASMSEKV